MSEFNLKVGDTAEMSRYVSEEDVNKMADLSLDFNPIHIDDEYAKKSQFGEKIAHGLFCAAMVSALLGMKVPGLGTIIVSETMRFKYPVYINDTITAQLKVERVVPERRRATISFVCKNQSGKTVMDGSSEVVVGK